MLTCAPAWCGLKPVDISSSCVLNEPKASSGPVQKRARVPVGRDPGCSEEAIVLTDWSCKFLVSGSARLVSSSFLESFSFSYQRRVNPSGGWVGLGGLGWDSIESGLNIKHFRDG